MKINQTFLICLSTITAVCSVLTAGPVNAGTDSPKDAPSARAEFTPLAGAEAIGTFDVKADGGVIDLSDFGMKITLPETIQDIPIAVNGYFQDGHAVANLCLTDESDPDNRECIFGEVFAYPDPQTLEDLISTTAGSSGDTILELGNNETLNYYILRLDELRRSDPEAFEKEFMAKLSADQRMQYEALLDALPELISGMELTEVKPPEMPKAAVPDAESLLNFTLPDLDGKETVLSSMIRDHRVTMLNVWGISCGVCMKEMPELDGLRERFGPEGFEIIGLAADLLDTDGSIDPELAEEAKEIKAELEIHYPILAMTKEIRTQLKITATPTTYFVSSSGQVLGEAVLGSRTEEEWETMIRSALTAAE